MSVRRDIIQGTIEHMVHKGGVLIFCGMYLTSRKIMSFYEVKVVVQKGGGAEV